MPSLRDAERSRVESASKEEWRGAHEPGFWKGASGRIVRSLQERELLVKAVTE